MCFANKSGFGAIALHIILLPSHYEVIAFEFCAVKHHYQIELLGSHFLMSSLV
ncbi:MAG: hypothetical protein V7K41_17715 [Nostoc sp.]|uniref:hypothetical protein n=1 Tax=Nostoc sp. TaxID=1180 RepID=UPI002FF83619